VFQRFFRRGQREEPEEEPQVTPEVEEKIEQSAKKTRSSFFGRIAVLLHRTEITDDTWDELEEILISADVGVGTTEDLLETMRARYRRGEFRTGDELTAGLQEELVALLEAPNDDGQPFLEDELTVVLVIGVNGVGKTTTIAKLGNYLRNEGRAVMLAAGDTFRAAGVEQLEVWANRINLPCVASQTGADPASVVYDGVSAAKARGLDTLLVDTAGRLHTKTNLMEELKKVRRIVDRQSVNSRSILVLDSTTGQNAIMQARSFAEAAGLDGIIVTKLDGTAKGGVLFSIVRELGAPVLFVGTGEKIDDISPFDPQTFVSALFSGRDDNQ
jgi:fused signal recognition particle receptor